MFACKAETICQSSYGMHICSLYVCVYSLVCTFPFVSSEQQKLLIQDMNKENHFISISHSGPIDGCDTSLVNQSVTMKCLASGHMSVTWYKNGEVLELSSEGTMYNQTSGELVIRREDACELLGVYQCFASNDIDTVHVSTRVLPFGKEIQHLADILYNK